MRVMIQVQASMRDVGGFGTYTLNYEPAKVIDVGALTDAGLELDEGFEPVLAPRARSDASGMQLATFSARPSFDLEDLAPHVLVRGAIPDDGGEKVLVGLRERPEVIEVFADPTIEPLPTCAGDPAVGHANDVASLLDVSGLQAQELTGEGVPVAIVDSGVNKAHLQAHGHDHRIDVANSFNPTGVTDAPFEHPVEHGTMCAFDVGIAAPAATLIDHALLLSTATPGLNAWLSDAVRSFAQLRGFLEGQPEDARRLVVTNSWGLYSLNGDLPVNDPGNYSDNPSHPFNLIVASLEDAGADILFAAGNCGLDCPAHGCGFAEQPIVGANSHPDVISVAGVNVNNERVGYSSQGPGRLAREKPDLSAYTHFTGSDAYPNKPDSGTSAACPVLAGVVAAVRTRQPITSLTPAALRTLLAQTATDLGAPGYDYDYGWGVVNVSGLLRALP